MQIEMLVWSSRYFFGDCETFEVESWGVLLRYIVTGCFVLSQDTSDLSRETFVALQFFAVGLVA